MEDEQANDSVFVSWASTLEINHTFQADDQFGRKREEKGILEKETLVFLIWILALEFSTQMAAGTGEEIDSFQDGRLQNVSLPCLEVFPANLSRV